jgi:hypothetical protein
MGFDQPLERFIAGLDRPKSVIAGREDTSALFRCQEDHAVPDRIGAIVRQDPATCPRSIGDGPSPGVALLWPWGMQVLEGFAADGDRRFSIT